MAIPTSSATAPTPADNDVYPGPQDHSFIWYFLVIGIEITVLVSLFVVTRYTVQHRSGLNEPDKIRRIWARAPEIRFQPVMRPLIFAIGVSYGSQTVIHAAIDALLSLVGLDVTKKLLGVIIGTTSLGASSLISVLVYRAAGGTNWKICAAATFLFDWFMSGILLNLSLGYHRSAGSGFSGFMVIALAYFIALAVIQIPFYIWGAYKRLPATARLIYNSSVVPNWVKIDRTILVASGPLALLYIIAYFCEFRLNCDTYLGNVTLALATLMLLAGSAITSIISVNRALLANEFQWQWRAFLTPAIPMGAMKLLVMFVKVITRDISFMFGLWSVIHFSCSIGGCGALGAYVYLKLAEKYAQAHIDDDMLAQDDLLAEFDEDEDNEELNV